MASGKGAKKFKARFQIFCTLLQKLLFLSPAPPRIPFRDVMAMAAKHGSQIKVIFPFAESGLSFAYHGEETSSVEDL